MVASSLVPDGVNDGGGHRSPPPDVLAEEVDVRRLRALVTLLGFVLDLRAFVQRAVTAPLNRAEVDEQVLTAFIGSDEAVALVRVEPLDSSGCHFCLSPPCQLHVNGQERCKPAPSHYTLKLQRPVYPGFQALGRT